MKKDGIIVYCERNTFVKNAKSGSTIKQGQQHFIRYIHIIEDMVFSIVLSFFMLLAGCSIVETSLDLSVSFYYRFYKFSRSVLEKYHSHQHKQHLFEVVFREIVGKR